RRQELGDARRPRGRAPRRLEDEGARQVAALGDLASDDGHPPRAIVGVAEDRGEDRRGVEPWQAQPVDRAGAGDEEAGAQIRQERVLLEGGAHPCPCYRRQSAAHPEELGARSSPELQNSVVARGGCARGALTKASPSVLADTALTRGSARCSGERCLGEQ